ncbi:major capsid protein [Bifidobacterium sp. ESL0745]|uniref:major capsid protein n=1 Tax=Bifidobacterium sp. ESL0745 TaxID=2983226 RepID=UPI0023F9AA12|nr:phage capsid protein [Bifidobacterium sp. ESL0745]MDF7665726.1 phage capsid protein [Bifidobacterium sp. ESL0745]
MAVTLAEAKNNTTEDFDPMVIDEFRKNSEILDSLIFDDCVSPAGGGATLDYGYRRLKTQPIAAFRAINTDYEPSNVETEKISVTLAVLGGSFEIDRVLANLGPEASGAVTLNVMQKVKAAIALFQDAVINGDTAVNSSAFDGLDKALTGSSTEDTGSKPDWTDMSDSGFKILDSVDDFLGNLDGQPTVIVSNKKALDKLRAAARRTSAYNRDPVEGLVGANGRPITREDYGGVLFVDAGTKAGSNDPIIPINKDDGTTDVYAYRVGLDGFHGISVKGGQLVQTFLPDFTQAGAVHKGEVELGPVGVALKATKAAAVLRKVKVQ